MVNGNVYTRQANLIDGTEKFPVNVCVHFLQRRENRSDAGILFIAASTVDHMALSTHWFLIPFGLLQPSRCPFVASGGASHSLKTVQVSSQEPSVPHELQTATDQLLRTSVRYSQDLMSEKRTYHQYPYLYATVAR